MEEGEEGGNHFGHWYPWELSGKGVKRRKAGRTNETLGLLCLCFRQLEIEGVFKKK